MFRATGVAWAKSLHAMLNRFKVAGAHPDILSSVDAEKASHNGQALIKLEQLLQARAVPPSGADVHDRYEQHDLMFWFRDSAARTADGLRPIRCTLMPNAADSVVKAQLQDLFGSAGLRDDFDLPRGPVSGDVGSVLDDVKEKHEAHVKDTQPLVVRGNKSVRFLRSLGIIVTINDRGSTYLLTMPERFDHPDSAVDAADSPSQSPEAREFLRERNMLAFDFRMGGSVAAVEQIVKCVEKLETLYRTRQGTCLRPGVCYALRLEGSGCSTLDDGTICLPASAPQIWEEFLLSLPQPTWAKLVQLHREWRSDNPTRLKDFNSRAKRVADVLHYHSVVFGSSASSSKVWQAAFVDMVLKEEGALRKTVEKYKAQLKNETLRKRGKLHVCQTLWEQGLTEAAGKGDKQVLYRTTSDGRVHINASMAKPVPLLKALRECNTRQAKLLLAFDAAMAELEGLSRSMCVEITIDPLWRDRCNDVARCVKHFVATAKPIAKVIAHKLQSQRQGLLLVVSDRYQVTPSGKACVPWDAEVGALQVAMIGR